MNLPAEDSPPPSGPEAPPRRFSWTLLFVSLLAPAALTSLTVLLDRTSNSPAPGVAVVGGLLGGIGCGVIIGRRLGRTMGLQVVFGVLFAGVGAVVSITIATIGCLTTGYQLNLH